MNKKTLRKKCGSFVALFNWRNFLYLFLLSGVMGTFAMIGFVMLLIWHVTGNLKHIEIILDGAGFVFPVVLSLAILMSLFLSQKKLE